MHRAFMTFLPLLAALALVSCNNATDTDRPRGMVTLTGAVQYHDAGMAIGGETDPYGYILKNNGRFDRLYLSRNGNLEADFFKKYAGEKVIVTGPLSTVTAGGVETPERTFPVLEVTRINPAGG